MADDEGVPREHQVTAIKLAALMQAAMQGMQEFEADLPKPLDNLRRMLMGDGVATMADVAAKLYKPKSQLRIELKAVEGWDGWIKQVNALMLACKKDEAKEALARVPFPTPAEAIAGELQRLGIGAFETPKRRAAAESDDDAPAKRSRPADTTAPTPPPAPTAAADQPAPMATEPSEDPPRKIGSVFALMAQAARSSIRA